MGLCLEQADTKAELGRDVNLLVGSNWTSKL